MPDKVECPVCGDEFSSSGFSSHLPSHNKDPIIEGLVEVVSESPSIKTTGDSKYGVEHDPWQTMKTQKDQVNRMRKQRDRRVRDHLIALDQQIKRTLR